MAESLKELKQEVGIITIPVGWNDPFPIKRILESYSKNEEIVSKLDNLASIITQYPSFYINTRHLYQLGTLAESVGLLLSYLVISPIQIELFFVDCISQKEWVGKFYDHLTRRKFFDYVKTWRLLGGEASLFPISTPYQLISPNQLPYYGNPKMYRLGTKYLLIQYHHEALGPINRIIKMGTYSFETFTPTISVDESLDPLKLEVDGYTFTGDSLKYLYNPEISRREKKEVKIIEEDLTYIFDPSTTTLIRERDGKQEIIPTKKWDTHPINTYAEPIIDQVFRGKRYILFSNAFLWDVYGEGLINIRSIPEFKTLSKEVFSCSNRNSVYVMLDGYLVEQVSTALFFRTLMKYISA